jgi:hypothetical protein
VIGYTTLGSNNMGESAKFYDALFAVCGASRIMDIGTFILWGTSLEDSARALAKPYDGNEATVGNGMMAAIRGKSKD